MLLQLQSNTVPGGNPRVTPSLCGLHVHTLTLLEDDMSFEASGRPWNSDSVHVNSCFESLATQVNVRIHSTLAIYKMQRQPTHNTHFGGSL